MTQRELSKAFIIVFGRKPRSDRGKPRSPQGWKRFWFPVEPSYQRVTPEKVRGYLRLRRNGRSLRYIARRYGRSHVTVARWITRSG